MPVISTNTAANSALISLNKNSRDMDKTLSKLSSGSKIVRASDDAAGLAVSTSLQSDYTTLRQAATNSTHARSILQTIDGALVRVQDMIFRMKSLTAQSNAGSIDNTQRGFLDAEYQHLVTEINNSMTITFDGIFLLDNSFNYNFQVGVNAVTDVISVNLVSIWMGGLTSLTTDVLTQANAVAASIAIEVDIDTLSQNRALVGAYLSRFEQRGDVIDSSIENLASAKSSIVDTDIAAEQTRLISSQVLTEASIAALAQANKMKSALLTLVK